MSVLNIHGCILVVLLCCFMHSVTAAITSPVEVTLLLDMKKSLTDPMKHLGTWNNGDPCTSNWTGVFCSDTILHDGFFHVERIHLLNMNLSGTLSPSLSQLPHLHILNFMWNNLTGSIPKEIGNITSLRLLLLSGNQLSGSLPEELGNLKNLDRLQIDQNNISGPVPKSFGNMKSVKHLHMNNNSISGQIPSDLSKLSRLHHLLLDNNNLSGYLPPELSYIPELRILQLDNNNLKGTEVPASYGSLPRLAKLSLRNCSLQGSIPDFSGIWSFMYLDLSYNQLSGSIPSKFPVDMTTIDLSDNHLNGSIPASFSDLPDLQKLSLKNNMLSGSVPANIWKPISFSATSTLLMYDMEAETRLCNLNPLLIGSCNLQNNSLSGIIGSLDPPQNVTLSLQGNPVCRNPNIQNVSFFCGHQAGKNETFVWKVNSTMSCPIQACPSDDFFEYTPASLEQCFCASPLQIVYRLKSPSFSYFPPFEYLFESYLTSSLELSFYQLLIDSLVWEEGPRLKMHLKIFPIHSSTFNTSEVLRIRNRFAQWEFPSNDFFGPYELLNFTLLGPYSKMKSEPSRRKISKGVLAIIVLGSIASASLISVFIIMIVRRHKRSQRGVSQKRLRPPKMNGVKSFTYDEMVQATDNFNSSSQIGRGGYGKVYRGILSDGTVVAIKRAEEGSLQAGKEFLTEIELLSRLHHRNLVQLIGYCDEEAEQMIVYEYMPNGTLREWLSGKEEDRLNFGTRLRMALGASKAILYLHTEVQPPIFHRDIKASNILLDSKFTAKVADFGLSRLAPAPDDKGDVQNYVYTAVKGTPGYLDPEYFLTHKLTDKSDVYSLGVVFLELLTGLHPIVHGKNLVREVNLAYQSDMLFSIIDRRMGSYPAECIERFAVLALNCCEDKPEKRPSMHDVLVELEDILRIYLDSEIALPKSLFTDSAVSGSTSSSFIAMDANDSKGLSGNDLRGIISTIVPR